MTPSAPARHAAPFDNAPPTDFDGSADRLRQRSAGVARLLRPARAGLAMTGFVKPRLSFEPSAKPRLSLRERRQTPAVIARSEATKQSRNASRAHRRALDEPRGRAEQGAETGGQANATGAARPQSPARARHSQG